MEEAGQAKDIWSGGICGADSQGNVEAKKGQMGGILHTGLNEPAKYLAAGLQYNIIKPKCLQKYLLNTL